MPYLEHAVFKKKKKHQHTKGSNNETKWRKTQQIQSALFVLHLYFIIAFLLTSGHMIFWQKKKHHNFFILYAYFGCIFCVCFNQLPAARWL